MSDIRRIMQYEATASDGGMSLTLRETSPTTREVNQGIIVNERLVFTHAIGMDISVYGITQATVEISKEMLERGQLAVDSFEITNIAAKAVRDSLLAVLKGIGEWSFQVQDVSYDFRLVLMDGMFHLTANRTNPTSPTEVPLQLKNVKFLKMPTEAEIIAAKESLIEQINEYEAGKSSVNSA